ncbi:hypothetical protein [Nocardioides sp. zg-DK7169]|uniref:hypothetical protein n=1 Tax=Nocardioides sp. zg-DK7169 TaxID=2736600 RepID=UPI001553E0C2|nr:hypothetical protein [Nocardioides sp. zg-DK7169]NPC98356.1 hypothetical protein [Nocardioides sp. zg-DK7169]
MAGREDGPSARPDEPDRPEPRPDRHHEQQPDPRQDLRPEDGEDLAYLDEHDDDTPPAWFAGQHLPEDARRMGLDHRVPDGALLDFAGRLDPSKRLHRVTAWVMLAVFGTPVVLHVVRLLRELGG